jgi:hypothetical protein
MDASSSSDAQEVKQAAFAKEELFVSEDYATELEHGSNLHYILDEALPSHEQEA